MRRILLILAAIILLIGIGVGIYFYFFAHKVTLTSSNGANFPASGEATNPETGQTTPTQDLGTPATGAGTEIAPRLIRITDKPVALGSVAVYVPGYRPATTTASTTEVARDPDVRVEYIERESGNIYAYQAHARTLTRLSNKTLPGVQEATWLSDGSLAYARFLEKSGTNEHIDTYALPATTTSGYFLQQDLAQVLARSTTTLVTLLSTTDGSSATVSTPSGTNVRTLFATPLSSIVVAFSGNNYVVTTKGSASMNGYSFIVDGTTGTFTRTLGPLQGLTALPSPSGKQILYSYIDRGKIALGVFDTTLHAATRLPLSTLPEKCAWSANGVRIYCGAFASTPHAQIPDEWYQGALSFNDTF